MDFANEIDDLKPITLKYNNDIVNRVYNRYPFLPKYKVALIVKNTFIVIRSQLIQNKVLCFSGFIPTLYFKFIKRFTNHQGNYPVLKIYSSISGKIKK